MFPCSLSIIIVSYVSSTVSPATMNIPLDDEAAIRPLDEETIEKNKKAWVTHANTQEIVSMVFSHISFVLITLAIIILYRDYYTFWSTKAIDDMFLVTNPKGEILYNLVSDLCCV